MNRFGLAAEDPPLLPDEPVPELCQGQIHNMRLDGPLTENRSSATHGVPS